MDVDKVGTIRDARLERLVNSEMNRERTCKRSVADAAEYIYRQTQVQEGGFRSIDNMDTWKMLVLARNKTYPYLTLSFDFGKEKFYVILIAKCCLVRTLLCAFWA